MSGSAIVVNVVGSTITIQETWTGSGPGVLQFSDFGIDLSNFTVIKEITNNSGTSWNRLANELLDPIGQLNDQSDVLPYPAAVPAGFSTSNDFDGLSFDQGGSIPRVSSIFPSVFADELTDARDFLDYFGGVAVSGGGVFTVQFGLDVGASENLPFLLLQRPNVSSRDDVVPEPATLVLIGSGLIAGLARRRRRGRL
jgi:hypothetical protein